MRHFLRFLTPVLLLFVTFSLIEAGLITDYADARARFGGRSFKRSMPRRKAPPVRQRMDQSQRAGRSSFGRGLAGGLLGGALGGLLFGGLFGMHGNGIGILPMLLLFGLGYFFYKRFFARPAGQSSPGYQPPPDRDNIYPLKRGTGAADAGNTMTAGRVDAPAADPVEAGIARIRRHDPDFDPSYFTEIASDVFFKVQAGWIRRDISSFRHLLGDKLAAEYEEHFAEMRSRGRINKLESIAIRNVEIVDADSDGREDFVTVLFNANLLDYTEDESTGELLEGSKTEPVKFAEKWTWARPTGTDDWRLEGIEETS